MKTARLVVRGIAVVAGGGAALLAGRSDAPVRFGVTTTTIPK
jgi:hypothetical protein